MKGADNGLSMALTPQIIYSFSFQTIILIYIIKSNFVYYNGAWGESIEKKIKERNRSN